ncbi:DUF6567 family protein [Dysgonomonas capnocytophagoides]|uniref:Lipoprotein n=1 Tax=Dysgonomonas capnocytophagoides TaxID=45254 RepID=A0A4Y8KWX1_9BACT|nr:DUF6567 family protein [Dysgonomonas capnocytophagoides]TFD91799.1 hypothetical protein E2605_19360 [Dysgonomonas capnocytophagoides]
MKKSLFLLITILSSVIIFSSCGASSEATSNMSQIQTNVTLSRKNYKIVGYVKGESKQTHVLGIGGLSRKSLSESAVSEMLSSINNETGAVAVINVNVQYKRQFYFFWSKTKAIANGTVIEFTE